MDYMLVHAELDREGGGVYALSLSMCKIKIQTSGIYNVFMIGFFRKSFLKCKYWPSGGI